MQQPKILLIATRRKGKLAEIKDILGSLNFHLVTLDNINFPQIEPEESGESFKENAIIKAKFYGNKSGLLTIADDSGLIIDVLPDRLGVRSKRYAKGTDTDRNNQLLKDLSNIPKEKRNARFICAIALFNPKTSKLFTSQGICEGKIALKSLGQNGFGYDPIFIVKDLDKHFAELSIKEKNQVSHRARALKEIKIYLEKYVV